MLLVLPSLYVPVAEYWRVAFKASVTAAGEIVMERNVPTVTRETLEVREPTVPVIRTGVLLAPKAVAIPLPLMLTAAEFPECHVTKFMMFCVLPSLYVPTAEYWPVAFKAKVTAAGEIVIPVNVGTKITEELEVTEFSVALIETGVLLAPTTVARPPLVKLTAAGFAECHATELLRSFVVPLL
jgi:hypothetical protein